MTSRGPEIDFCDQYAKATNASDMSFFERAYAPVFMFAGPQNVQAVRREDFLKVLPRRRALVTSAGLVETSILTIECESLNGGYSLVHTNWQLRFEKASATPVVVDAATTYILRTTSALPEIVFQLDHSDLAAILRERKLLPENS